ncbi:MAG: biotin/lipoyl-containing protein [Kofleriaceae bacterium]
MTLTARTLQATLRIAGEQVELTAPSPGRFRIAVRVGDVIHGDSLLGSLEVLGHAVALHAPPQAQGVVVSVRDPSLARPPVDHGAVLVTLDPRVTAGAAPIAAVATPHAVDGLVFRAPTSGRYYGRSSPDKPPFVAAGDELAQGTTICLLEVMKTFHRVTYGGPGVPERAKIRELLVADGADVNAGDPLLLLDG